MKNGERKNQCQYQTINCIFPFLLLYLVLFVFIEYFYRMLPKIALIGRPNVGKSALFNRLSGKKHAIVSEVAGTTRDVLEAEFELTKTKKALIIDMAGIHETRKNLDEITQHMQNKTDDMLAESHGILFCIDVTAPLTQDDLFIAEKVRKAGKPTILLLMKCDNSEQIKHMDPDIYGLGFENYVSLSSLHNRGIDELKTKLSKLFPVSFFKEKDEVEKQDKSATKDILRIRVALVGRPNVGKSSLFNTLFDEEKSIVSDIAGTTRDTIDSILYRNGVEFHFIDTAGLKRPGKTERGIESFSRLRTFRAISRADVCLFMIDASEKVNNIDQNISRYILEENKGLIILANKWDKINQEEDMMDRFLTYFQQEFAYLPWAPVLFVSAKEKTNIDPIFENIVEIYQQRQARIETGKLNRFVQKIVVQHPPKGTKAIRPKIYYATQVEVNPPHIILFVNEALAFHFSWRRYFEHQFREKFGFSGTPITIEYRNREREDRSGKKGKRSSHKK